MKIAAKMSIAMMLVGLVLGMGIILLGCAFAPWSMTRGVGFIVLSVFVMGGVAWGTTHILVRPLEQLKGAVDKTEKERGAPPHTGMGSGDEMEALVMSFKRMDQEVKEASVFRDYFWNIIRSMVDSLMVVTRDGKIETVNDATLELLGYTKDELVGQDVSLVLNEEVFSREELFNALSDTKVVKDVEIVYKMKMGGDIPVSLSGSVLSKKEGEASGFGIVAHNITRRRRMEEDLRRTNQGLLQSERATLNMFADLHKAHEDLKSVQAQLVQSEKLASVGQLAAGIAHEINNPIGFINSNCQTLEQYVANLTRIFSVINKITRTFEEKDMKSAARLVEEVNKIKKEIDFDFITGDIKNLLAETIEGVNRITKIVADLRTFARQDTGQMERHKIDEILDSILSIVCNEIKYRVNIKKEYGDLPPVLCNAQKLGQVFLNLIINAAQAIKGEGEIVIKTYQKGSCAYVEVIDTGEGIGEEQMKKIFDPFYTTKPVGTGTGLGLSISREIVKKHGGDLTVASTVGKGATFTVILPILPAASKQKKEV